MDHLGLNIFYSVFQIIEMEKNELKVTTVIEIIK